MTHIRAHATHSRIQEYDPNVLTWSWGLDLFIIFYIFLFFSASYFINAVEPVKTFAWKHTLRPPHSNFKWVDPCSWFCIRYAKSTSEYSKEKMIYCMWNSLFWVQSKSLLISSSIFCPFEDCDVCVCIVTLNVLAACKWLYVGVHCSSC